jgi:cold shock protein
MSKPRGSSAARFFVLETPQSASNQAYARRKKGKEEMKGNVKWFNDQKGFGFITPEDGTPDVFVHHTTILMDGFKSLAENQKVEYDLVQSEKGPKAANVRPLALV